MSWCWNMAMATHCGWEKQCRDLWDSLALGNVADGDSEAQGKRIKCSVCTKVLKRIRKLAGDDPDEAAVAAALQKGCRRLGGVMGKVCQQLVKKYQDQITEGLQNGDMPQDICSALGFCQS
ncbi:hypothetical protein Nmel_018500 [Mimus melanotis]